MGMVALPRQKTVQPTAAKRLSGEHVPGLTRFSRTWGSKERATGAMGRS